MTNDHFHDECGIVGIVNHTEAANLAYLGLFALQHRGQESAGICSSDGEQLWTHNAMGLVSDVFSEATLAPLRGTHAIGHVRYSTTGSSILKNAQPFVVRYMNGSIGVAHNGNITNAAKIRETLEKDGAIFQSTMDTEVFVHLIARSKKDGIVNKIDDACSHVTGAYCLLFITETSIIAVRDPYGIRPLVLGKLGNTYVVASETCALDLIDANYIREVEPGEMIVFDRDGMNSRRLTVAKNVTKTAKCVFEHVYFARPDSVVFGNNSFEMRKRMGMQLGSEHYVDADMVIPVPDSGIPAAIGYAIETKIPFEFGLIRSHYVGRTFIEPKQSIRHFGVKLKLNPMKHYLDGKRVVVVDDSLVRGTTAMKIVSMIRHAGAKEVHLRLASPPIISPCFYGIDTPTKTELIANSNTVEDIRKFIAADSLGYLSRDGLKKCMGDNAGSFCYACFSGEYPF